MAAGDDIDGAVDQPGQAGFEVSRGSQRWVELPGWVERPHLVFGKRKVPGADAGGDPYAALLSAAEEVNRDRATDIEQMLSPAGRFAETDVAAGHHVLGVGRHPGQ